MPYVYYNNISPISHAPPHYRSNPPSPPVSIMAKKDKQGISHSNSRSSLGSARQYTPSQTTSSTPYSPYQDHANAYVQPQTPGSLYTSFSSNPSSASASASLATPNPLPTTLEVGESVGGTPASSSGSGSASNSSPDYVPASVPVPAWASTAFVPPADTGYSVSAGVDTQGIIAAPPNAYTTNLFIGSPDFTSPPSASVPASASSTIPSAPGFTTTTTSGAGSGSGGVGGGSAGGTKTPKKAKVVQWLDHHLNSQREREEREREGWERGPFSPHALDEKGIDLNPFNELTSALERHQSQSQAGHPSQYHNQHHQQQHHPQHQQQLQQHQQPLQLQRSQSQPRISSPTPPPPAALAPLTPMSPLTISTSINTNANANNTATGTFNDVWASTTSGPTMLDHGHGATAITTDESPTTASRARVDVNAIRPQLSYEKSDSGNGNSYFSRVSPHSHSQSHSHSHSHSPSPGRSASGTRSGTASASASASPPTPPSPPDPPDSRDRNRKGPRESSFGIAHADIDLDADPDAEAEARRAGLGGFFDSLKRRTVGTQNGSAYDAPGQFIDGDEKAGLPRGGDGEEDARRKARGIVGRAVASGRIGGGRESDGEGGDGEREREREKERGRERSAWIRARGVGRAAAKFKVNAKKGLAKGKGTRARGLKSSSPSPTSPHYRSRMGGDDQETDAEYASAPEGDGDEHRKRANAGKGLFSRLSGRGHREESIKRRDYGNEEIDLIARGSRKRRGWGGNGAESDSDGMGVGPGFGLDVERDADTDGESFRSAMMPHPAGNGVLSALLALYNAQNSDGMGMGIETPSVYSGASTPGTLEDYPDRPWVKGDREKERERRKMAREEREREISAISDASTKVEVPPIPSLSESPKNITPSQTQVDPDSSIPSPTSANPLLSSQRRSLQLPSTMRGMTSSAKAFLGLGTSRPPQARNGGGVFGSLIASTGNISGVAAPAPSTLAPSVKRPGYNLSRYSYGDDDAVSLKSWKKGKGEGERKHQPSKSLSNVELESIGTGTGTVMGSEYEIGDPLTRTTSTPTPTASGFGFAARQQMPPHSSILVNHNRPRSEIVHVQSPLVHAYSSKPSSEGGEGENGAEAGRNATYTTAHSHSHSQPLARTPVSAYIDAPAETDYFDSDHRRMNDNAGERRGDGHGHSKSSSGGFSSIAKRTKWTGVLKDLPYAGSIMNLHMTPGGGGGGGRSGKSTPATTPGSTTTSERGEWSWYSEKESKEDREKREKRERERRERKKRKKAQIYITRHVAQIIQRQEFICKLARAMMMFGGPAHRLQSQISATARVLDIEVSCMYLPDVMLISFDDSNTGTSLIKFIRQGSMLDLGKLNTGYLIYWAVIHDDVSVSEASSALDHLMRSKPHYNWWQIVFIGGMCSAAICTVSFNGSFIDAVAVFPLGALLVGVQLLSVRNELYSNVFEITISTLFSFLCGALAATGKICYSAAAASSIVLILPGFIVLSGALEVLSRNIVAGSVRMCYAVVYCLFLGFGLAMGAEAYEKIIGRPIYGLSDTTCAMSHDPTGPWWQRPPSEFWAFLTVPMYSLFLSMKNQQPLFKKEMLILVIISCIGWVTNHFTSTKFVNQSDISSAVGAFAVGFISNMYGRFLSGNAFVIMITGILFQVPSGLGSGGLLVFVSEQSAGSSTSYLSGFQTALQLISVAIGLTVGLGISLFLAHPIQSRRRAGGIFSL